MVKLTCRNQSRYRCDIVDWVLIKNSHYGITPFIEIKYVKKLIHSFTPFSEEFLMNSQKRLKSLFFFFELKRI